MYAILGITGQVRGAVARPFSMRASPVRAVVRDPSKGSRGRRADAVAIADMTEPPRLPPLSQE